MKSALLRYRVSAYVTGVFLLLLTTNVILKYVLGQHGIGSWVAIVHGWLYLAYVIITVDLWFRTRPGPDNAYRPEVLPVLPTVLVVLAGTIPFMSFVAERWVHARVQPLVEAGTTAA